MKNKANSILAFIPQSKEGELALKEALYFQRVFGIRIFVLNVIHGPSSIFSFFKKGGMDREINDAKQQLTDFVKAVIKKDIPKDIIIKIRVGDLVSSLIDESKKGGHEFIIVDKSRSSFSGPLHWYKIDKFISRSYCPVLAINKDFPVREIKKIVVPIDISLAIKKRLLWASLFAKTFNAEIQVVAVLNINIDETNSLAYKNAKKIKHFLWEQDIDCDVKILKSKTKKKYKVLLEHLTVEKPELVIIRTHEEPAFSGTNIGKFVSKIVHGCNMPVFTVNYSQQPFVSSFFKK